MYYLVTPLCLLCPLYTYVPWLWHLPWLHWVEGSTTHWLKYPLLLCSALWQTLSYSFVTGYFCHLLRHLNRRECLELLFAVESAKELRNVVWAHRQTSFNRLSCLFLSRVKERTWGQAAFRSTGIDHGTSIAKSKAQLLRLIFLFRIFGHWAAFVLGVCEMAWCICFCLVWIIWLWEHNHLGGLCFLPAACQLHSVCKQFWSVHVCVHW